MPMFRQRPTVIEAVQWTGDNLDEIHRAFDADLSYYRREGMRTLMIYTQYGTMTVLPDDWIIKNTQDEFHSCRPDIFPMIFEAVVE